MNKKYILISLVLIVSGCSIKYPYDTDNIGWREYGKTLGPCQDCPDSCCYLMLDGTTPYRWYYACDSVHVCNANLTGLGIYGDVSSRVFSSDDIAIIRDSIKNQTRYFEILEVGWLPGKSLYYLYIPFRKRQGLKMKRYYFKIPITRTGKDLYVHQRNHVDSVFDDNIKKHLYGIMDSTSVNMWEEECKRGTIIMEKESDCFYNYIRTN